MARLLTYNVESWLPIADLSVSRIKIFWLPVDKIYFFSTPPNILKYTDYNHRNHIQKIKINCTNIQNCVRSIYLDTIIINVTLIT